VGLGVGWLGREDPGSCPPNTAPSPLDSDAGNESLLSAGVYFYSLLKNIPVRVTGT